MNKKRLLPIQKIEIGHMEIGDSVEIHGNRLASFKATVSRYNKDNRKLYAFDYSGIKNDYCTATRKADRKPSVKSTAP